MKEVSLPIKFTTPQDVVRLKVTRYLNNKRIAIVGVDDSTQEPYFTLTLNDPSQPLGDYEFFIKDYLENEELARIAFKTGMFIDIQSSHLSFPVWKFTEEIQAFVEKGLAE